VGPAEDVTQAHTVTQVREMAHPQTNPASALVAGLDLLTVRERDGDHLLSTIGRAVAAWKGSDFVGATHWAQVGELRHVALTVASVQVDADELWDCLAEVIADQAGAGWTQGAGLLLDGRYRGSYELREPLESAVAAHQEQRSGRVVLFPGSERLTRTLTVGEVLACTAIDRVRVLAAGEPDPATPLVTRDFVRPRWSGGELVLDTQPAIGGTLVPFETPHPTACCVDHA